MAVMAMPCSSGNALGKVTTGERENEAELQKQKVEILGGR